MSSRYSQRFSPQKKTIDTGAKAGSLAAGRKAAQAALAASMGQKIASPQKSSPPKKAPIDAKVDPKAKNAAANALASKLNFGGGPRRPPPSSAGGGSGGISEADKASAQPYLKMMKLKMPEGAVRHKMAADGISSHVQDYVISGGDGGGSSSRNAPSSGGGGGLSEADKASAQPYLKMVKMKMPEGAVRHKMNADGISSHVQDFVMSGGVESSSGGGGGGISEADKATAQPYLKMVKMKMPEGAIRHKMNADGIPNHIQDFVMSGGVEPSSGGGSGGGISEADKATAQPYLKMVKMKMPEGAVRHKMNADGIANHIQEFVISGGVAPSSSSSSSLSSPKKAPGGGNYSSLSSADENIATKYRKMMKMGLPEGAIRQKMAVEGVAENIQKSVLAGEIPDPNAPKYSTLSPQDEGVATQYRKMLKMGLPEGAVVQRMKINGVSDDIVKSVLAREVPDPNAGAAAAAPANPMASAFAAITSGDPSALLKKTDGPQAGGSSSDSTPSNPGSALAAAAAAASKRRMKTGDELALEIERNKQKHAGTSSSGTGASSIAAAAVAAASKRGGGDSIADEIERKRKERTMSNAGSSMNMFAGKLKKTAPRRNQSDFGAIAPSMQGLKIPTKLNPPKARDRSNNEKSPQTRSKSNPLLGPNGLARRFRPGNNKSPTQQQQSDPAELGPNGMPRRTRSSDDTTMDTPETSPKKGFFGMASLKKVGTPGRSQSDFGKSAPSPTQLKSPSSLSSSSSPAGPNGLPRGPRPPIGATKKATEKPSSSVGAPSPFGQVSLRKVSTSPGRSRSDLAPVDNSAASPSTPLKSQSDISEQAPPGRKKLAVTSIFSGKNKHAAAAGASPPPQESKSEDSKQDSTGRKSGISAMFSGKSKPAPEEANPTEQTPVTALQSDDTDTTKSPSKGRKLGVASLFSGKSKSTPTPATLDSTQPEQQEGDANTAPERAIQKDEPTPSTDTKNSPSKGRKLGVASLFSGKSKSTQIPTPSTLDSAQPEQEEEDAIAFPEKIIKKDGHKPAAGDNVVSDSTNAVPKAAGVRHPSPARKAASVPAIFRNNNSKPSPARKSKQFDGDDRAPVPSPVDPTAAVADSSAKEQSNIEPELADRDDRTQEVEKERLRRKEQEELQRKQREEELRIQREFEEQQRREQDERERLRQVELRKSQEIEEQKRREQEDLERQVERQRLEDEQRKRQSEFERQQKTLQRKQNELEKEEERRKADFELEHAALEEKQKELEKEEQRRKADFDREQTALEEKQNELESQSKQQEEDRALLTRKLRKAKVLMGAEPNDSRKYKAYGKKIRQYEEDLKKLDDKDSRIAAEKVEAERAAEQRAKDEKIRISQAKADADRVAAEKARSKSLEGERIAKEKAAEAVRVADAAKLEEERIAMEKRHEAERWKAIEEERISKEKAIEEGKRVAREKQAEAERIATEKKAERIRIAAQEEAERIAAIEREAAQAEAERIAFAEKEAASRAEAERVAAEKEAKRIAAEVVEDEYVEEEKDEPEPGRPSSPIYASAMGGAMAGSSPSGRSSKAAIPAIFRNNTAKPTPAPPILDMSPDDDLIENNAPTHIAPKSTPKKPTIQPQSPHYLQEKTRINFDTKQETPNDYVPAQKENIANKEVEEEEEEAPSNSGKKKKKRVRKQKKGKRSSVRDDGTEQHCIIM